MTRLDEPGGRSSPAASSISINELIGMTILAHVVFAGVRVDMTLTAIKLGASSFVVGTVLSTLAFLPMVLAIPGGRWIDRIGVRWPMFIGLAVMAVGAALPLAVFSLASLYLCALLVGIGFLPYHLAAQKAIADMGTPEDRRHNFSLFAIGYSISGFIGPTSTGFMIDGIGHRMTFGVLALMGVVAVAWLWNRRILLSDRGAAVAASAGPLRTWDLLRSPELRRLYLVVAVVSSAWDVHQFLVPLYGAQIGLSASAIGLILGSFAVATLVVRMIVPIFLSNVSEWWVVGVGQGIAALVFAVYPFSMTLETLLALSFVLGLGLGASQPMVLSLLAKTAPGNRLGEAVGLRVMLVNGTQTVLPGLSGAVGGVIGVSALFWSVGSMLAGGSAQVGLRLLRSRGAGG